MIQFAPSPLTKPTPSQKTVKTINPQAKINTSKQANLRNFNQLGVDPEEIERSGLILKPVKTTTSRLVITRHEGYFTVCTELKH